MSISTRLAPALAAILLISCTHSVDKTITADLHDARAPGVEFDIVSWTPTSPDGRVVPGGVASHPSGDLIVSARASGPNDTFVASTHDPRRADICVVSRVSTSGQVMWASGLPCPRNGFVPLIATNDRGQIYAVVDTRNSQALTDLKSLPEPVGDEAPARAMLHALSADGASLWRVPLFGDGSEDEGRIYARALTATSNGDIVVVGAFRGTARLGDARLVSRGKLDAWFARVSADGVIRDVRTNGSTGNDQWTTVAAAQNGGVVIGGYIGGHLSDGALDSLIHSNSAFVARFREDGAAEWSRAWGAPHTGTSVAQLDVAPDGRVAFLAAATGPVDFGAGPVLASHGSHKSSLGLLAADGTTRWVRGFGGDANTAGDVVFQPDGSLRASIAIDQTTDNQVVDHVSYDGEELRNETGTDALIVDVAADDGSLRRVMRFDAVDSGSQASAPRLVCDPSGATVAVGRYAGQVEFDRTGPRVTPGRDARVCDSSRGLGHGVDLAHEFGCEQVTQSATGMYLMRLE